MKGYEKWIMIFGFPPEKYDSIIETINYYKKTVVNHGVCYITIKEFIQYIMKLTAHSACIDFTTIRNECRSVICDWIEGGGLISLPEKISTLAELPESERPEAIKTMYKHPYTSLDFMTLCDYFFIGITFDGNIVLDTKKQFETNIKQHEYISSTGDFAYLTELVEIIDKNIKAALLPEVPVGILKLPESMEVES